MRKSRNHWITTISLIFLKVSNLAISPRITYPFVNSNIILHETFKYLSFRPAGEIFVTGTMD